LRPNRRAAPPAGKESETSVEHLRQGDDAAVRGLQALSHMACQGDGGGLVAMHADGLDLDVDPLAVARGEAAVLDHAEALLQRLVGILEHRARDRARAEVAVVLVVAVGEALARQPEPERARGLLHLRARPR